MTSDRIAELRALVAKSSTAPWEIEQDQEGGFMVCGMTIAQTAHPKHDAAFIAAARTALPEALDAIERVRDVCHNELAWDLNPFVGRILAALEGKSDG